MIGAWLALQGVVCAVAVGVAGLDRARTAPRAEVLAIRGWTAFGVAWVALRALWPSGWTPPPSTAWVPEAAAALVPAARVTVGAAPAAVVDGLPVVGAVLLGLAGLRLLRDAAALAGLVRRTRVVRRIGRVEIRVGDFPGAFAAWTPGRCRVILDRETWADPSDRAIAVRHELRHHRHGDAAWAWFWALLGAVCAPNPAALWLVARVRVLDELACDAAVVRTVDPARYAESLLRAARRARVLPLALPAAALPPLTERILAMTSPRVRTHHVVPAFLAVLLLVGVAGSASGSSGLSGRAFERAAVAASDPALVVPADPLVRSTLDEMLSSPDGRSFLGGGLDRSARWASLVEPALAGAGLPPQLAAIPLVESGYRNFGVDPGGVASMAPGMAGSGLWMFVPETARTYGLRVDVSVDERLDPARETEAAVALLADLHDQFGDWGLALAAWNQGPKHVRAAIETHGTRDVLALCAKGALNAYVPTVYAAMLVRAEPSLVGR